VAAKYPFMKNYTSRRLFLRTAALATTGITLLSSTSALSALVEENSPYNGYNPFAENTTDLRTSILGGKYVTIKGIVYDETGKHPVPEATIEVWHLSPNSKKYRHRAKMKTNSAGEYTFKTDFPNNEPGKSARIYYKVSTRKDSYFTELSLNSLGAHITDTHWVKNKQLEEKLFPKQEYFLNNATVTFNLSI